MGRIAMPNRAITSGRREVSPVRASRDKFRTDAGEISIVECAMGRG